MLRKKILLVGGCGFIGHNLALNLKKKNFNVYITDSLAVNNLLSFSDYEIKNKKLYSAILNNRIEILNHEKIQLIVQDARDYSAISKIYSEIDPDIIVHLAAVSHANKSNKDPHSTFDHSLRTLENTLDFARRKRVHVVYISSSMVYGNFESQEVSEDIACNPIGIYGNLKFAGELIVKSYNQVFDLPYTIIRPSALYGERCVSRRVGQIFIENAIQDLDITINGDGNEKLDFTYIEDLVHGISLTCGNTKAYNKTFNITYGNSRSISELANILKNEFPKINIIYNNEIDKLVPRRGTLSIKHAETVLGFKPKYSIEDGYVRYIEWYKNFWKNFR